MMRGMTNFEVLDDDGAVLQRGTGPERDVDDMIAKRPNHVRKGKSRARLRSAQEVENARKKPAASNEPKRASKGGPVQRSKRRSGNR